MKWLKPVRPGMILSMTADVLSARASQSRPNIGLVQFRFTTMDQTGTSVMTQENFVMMGRRGSKQEPHRGAKPQGSTPLLPFDKPEKIPPFAELEPGQRVVLGSIEFTQESVLDFANRYDPQPFHTDLAAAETGPFGGLAASGWHTAASWMRCFVNAVQNSGAAVQAGPSPGFTNLRWLKPVYAGDTISYDTRLLEKRLTSRPGWGLVKSKNSGTNQHGVTVFEFESAGFWKVT